jgi:hypothetical protein
LGFSLICFFYPASVFVSDDLGVVCPELLILLRWVIEKLVDGLVIDLFSFGAYSLSDLLFESSGDLLGGPAQLQLLKDKASKSRAVA